jgi:hypothetical protein
VRPRGGEPFTRALQRGDQFFSPRLVPEQGRNLTDLRARRLEIADETGLRHAQAL